MNTFSKTSLYGVDVCYIKMKSTSLTCLFTYICSCQSLLLPNRAFHHRHLSPSTTRRSTPRVNPVILQDSSFPWEASLSEQAEETLLKINLAVINSSEDALARVQKYTQGFPFAAVLPVQPLQYLPTREGGVDVIFMRKKTPEKGSIDGGMRFYVRSGIDTSHVEIEVKRNSEGQTISKLFTEKLVVLAYCSGIKGQEDDRFGKSPSDVVAIESIFHLWM
jgi:hypothetical protein